MRVKFKSEKMTKMGQEGPNSNSARNIVNIDMLKGDKGQVKETENREGKVYCGEVGSPTATTKLQTEEEIQQTYRYQPTQT